MLRNFLKNKKAQNTAEYALLIALVVAGIIAMQTYAQRALQARIHDVSVYMANSSMNGISGGGTYNTVQYEPTYLSSKYDSTRNSADTTFMNNETIGYNTTSNVTRTGNQLTTYNTADEGATN